VNTLQKVLLSKTPFAKPENVIQQIPFDKVTLRPDHVSHSLYEELWHIDYWMRFSLALIRGENPVLPEHSTESFPPDNAALSEAAWQTLVRQVLEGLNTLVVLGQNETELARMFDAENTVHDELIIIAAHNAYHFGRMVMLRQLLGIWPSELGVAW
jgi:uncharacterized damage-inducible protein DinB